MISLKIILDKCATAITTALSPYRTATAQDTATSSAITTALSPYRTSSAQDTLTASTITTALTPYRTSSAQDTLTSSTISTALSSYSNTTAMNAAIASALTAFTYKGNLPFDYIVPVTGTIQRWYIDGTGHILGINVIIASLVSGSLTGKLQKNGVDVTGSSFTLTSGTLFQAVTFTSVAVAQGDVLDVVLTGIGVSPGLLAGYVTQTI